MDCFFYHGVQLFTDFTVEATVISEIKPLILWDFAHSLDLLAKDYQGVGTLAFESLFSAPSGVRVGACRKGGFPAYLQQLRSRDGHLSSTWYLRGGKEGREKLNFIVTGSLVSLFPTALVSDHQTK